LSAATIVLLFLMLRRRPRSPLFPYTTLFRSAMAQRCSGVAPPAPLFSAILNYRHSRKREPEAVLDSPLHAVEWLGAEERTNYPRSEEHTSELQSLAYPVCRLLLEKKEQHPYP